MDSGRRSHRPPPLAGGGGVAGGREDCWSEGATAALVEAWGDRYLQLSRGNLRQKDWKEVADAVNERQAIAGRPPKTDGQCKNRIDTIKKKYKAEKAKPGPSGWPFFSRLDFLVGPTSAAAAAAAPSLKKPHPPPLVPHGKQRHSSLSFAVKARNLNENPYVAVYSGGSSSRSRVISSGSSESSHGEFVGRNGYGVEEDDDDAVEEDEEEQERRNGFLRPLAAIRKRQRNRAGLGVSGGGGGEEEGAFGELARAIVRFAEVYERMETLKQQQVMELERQRMEFARDLEFQRMQMFMEAQLELEKLKRPKYASGSGKRSYSGFQAPH